MSSDDKNDPGYTVGYMRPPKDKQFKAGQSGNPRGRPRNSFNLETMILKELKRRIQITENGRTKTITLGEASIKSLVHGAAKGDIRKLQMLHKLIPRAEPEPFNVEESDLQILKELLDRTDEDSEPDK